MPKDISFLLTGTLKAHGATAYIAVDHGGTWELSHGGSNLAAHIDRRVTLRGFTYAPPRFEAIELVE